MLWPYAFPLSKWRKNSHKRASLRWLHICLGLFRARISSPPHLRNLPATSMALPAEAGSLAYTQAMAEPSSPREGGPGRWLAGPCYLAGLADEGSCPRVWFTAWALNPSPCSVRNTTSSRKEWLEPMSWQWGITPPTDLDGIQPKPPSSRNKSAALRILFKSTSGRYRPSCLLAYPCSKAPPHCAMESWPALPGMQSFMLPNKLLNPAPLQIFFYSLTILFPWFQNPHPLSWSLILRHCTADPQRVMVPALRTTGSKV